jgi:hypothetical protein
MYVLPQVHGCIKTNLHIRVAVQCILLVAAAQNGHHDLSKSTDEIAITTTGSESRSSRQSPVSTPDDEVIKAEGEADQTVQSKR